MIAIKITILFDFKTCIESWRTEFLHIQQNVANVFTLERFRQVSIVFQFQLIIFLWKIQNNHIFRLPKKDCF